MAIKQALQVFGVEFVSVTDFLKHWDILRH